MRNLLKILTISLLLTSCRTSNNKNDATTLEVSRLRDLLKSGGTINLENKVYNLDLAWQPILVTEEVTIHGHGAKIIGPKGQVFFYTSSNVTLDSLAIEDFSTGVSIVKGAKEVNLQITNCDFHNNVAAIYSPGAVRLNGSINNNLFSGTLQRSTRAIYLNTDSTNELTIEKNNINNYQHYGILLQGGRKDNSKRQNIKILKNTITNIDNSLSTKPGKQNVIGIKVDAWAPIIKGNTIKNINGKMSDDREGIYTKSAFAKIEDNTLIDAGVSEGYIAIKGKREGMGQPEGHHVTVSGNTFLETRGEKSHFLRIANSHVTIKNNNFSNGYQAIHTNPSAAGDSITIINNTFENISTSCLNLHTRDMQGIYVEANAFASFGNAITFDRCINTSYISISNNTFSNLVGSIKSAIVFNSDYEKIAADEIQIYDNTFSNLRHAIYIKNGNYDKIYTEENAVNNVAQEVLYRAKAGKVKKHIKKTARKKE